jgi:hypothetical protein
MAIAKKDAIAKAIEMGSSQAEIDRQAANYVRQVGSVPFRNMITALSLHSWHNTPEQWERLAAALTARQMARQNKGRGA